MRTILLISPYWQEKHRWMASTVKLADLWQRLGYHVEVVCMGPQNDRVEITDHVIVHRRKDLFLPDPWNYGIAFGFTGHVRKLIEEIQPDHIVVNKILFWTSLCVIPLRLTGHKVTLLTDALVGITWWPRGLLPKIAAFFYAQTLGRLIMLSAKRVVFFHPQPKSVLRSLFVSKKSQVIPTGIDPLPYSMAEDIRKKEEGITVTYVGRLESIKGVEDFLDVVTKVDGISPQVIGWYKEGHPLVTKYEKQVRFTGLRADIADILARTHIFIMPSYSEGLSNAIMEAMASNCAVIATEVGGNGYLIQNGVSGLLYPAGDREALKSHLQRLLDDPAKREALGTGARERIEKEFSWEVVGKKYEQVFDG